MPRTPRIALSCLCVALLPLACWPPKPPIEPGCVFEFTMSGHGNQRRFERLGHGGGPEFELDVAACQAGGRIQINLSHDGDGARLYAPPSNSCVMERSPGGTSRISFTLKVPGCEGVLNWEPEPSSPGVLITIKPRP
jgi:hypothetical protein